MYIHMFVFTNITDPNPNSRTQQSQFDGIAAVIPQANTKLPYSYIYILMYACMYVTVYT